MPPDTNNGTSSGDQQPTAPTTNKHDSVANDIATDIANEARKPSKICLACGAEGVKNRCGACRQVYFCDRECQKQIWVSHRPECARLITTAAAATVDESNVTANSNANNEKPKPTTNKMGESANANKSTAEVKMPPSKAADQHEHGVTAPAATSVASGKAPPKKKSVVVVPEPQILAVVIPDEEETPIDCEATKPKKKKHKKKKKPRSNSLHAPASAPMPRHAGASLKNRSQSLSAKKHVVWGDVFAREFTRFPGGGGAVPYDGSWALGLGSPVADVQLGSVLEVEELRLLELDARAKDLPKSQRSRVREGETRQFDYKSGSRNPLFGRLNERERKKLFSESELHHEAEDAAAEEALHPHHHHHHHQQQQHHHHTSQSPARRKRTMSCEGEEPEHLALDGADFACVSSEQLDEFVKIRDSRDDACGCTCGDLLKKVAKMNVKKLHAFLVEREAHISGHNKPELLASAKAIALREKNCGNAKFCECARNGVPCHSNVCDGCAGDCFNPHDTYEYQKDHVLKYRKMQIAKWNEQYSHELGPSIHVA